MVDDNASTTKALSSILRKKGHDCVVLNNGKDGLQAILNQKFDVVILDIFMPGFSGLNVIDSLEQSGKLKEHKIIVFTSTYFEESWAEKLVRRGVYACIEKTDFDKLFELIESS